MRVAGKARQHLQGFLLRHSRIYPGSSARSASAANPPGEDLSAGRAGQEPIDAGSRWGGLRIRRNRSSFRSEEGQRAFQWKDCPTNIDAVAIAEARVERLTNQIADLLPSWSLAPVVDALQAMRGVGFIVAVTVGTEVGDFGRFDTPRQLMAYLGLTPSEH